jgi:hypothetical protein
MDQGLARECMAAARDAGVNFFDNAEVYAKGAAETIMGDALRKLGWRRASYVVSTKFYWGLYDGPNERNTLNRKYLMQAIDGSLARARGRNGSTHYNRGFILPRQDRRCRPGRRAAGNPSTSRRCGRCVASVRRRSRRMGDSHARA